MGKPVRTNHKADYALTFDTMLTMLAIYFRVKAGIPLILSGETGCGKTSLIQYLCDFLGIELFKKDIHGGITERFGLGCSGVRVWF